MTWRTEALAKRLQAIPDGRVSETARKARLTLRHLMRLREGKNLKVRLSTLEGLAEALGEPISAILGETDVPPPIAPAPAVDPRVVRRLIRKLRDLADDVERLEKQLGEK